MIRGKCFCGDIQFSLEPPTDMCSHCHCESCRRSHGSAFVTWTSVPDKQFHIKSGKDLLSKYESSKDVFWMFCSKCGSPLFQATKDSPNRVYVSVASLIDPLDRSPSSHVSYEEKLPWIEINDGLPCYREKASERLK